VVSEDITPIFDLVEGGYYIAIWYLAGVEQDWLAMLYREPGKEKLTLKVRFRYYRDDKIFYDETADEKSAYGFTTDKPEDQVIADVDEVAKKMIARNYCGTKLPWKVRDRYTRRVTKCGPEEFARLLLSMPFTHWKRADLPPTGAKKSDLHRRGEGD
jgi:hypothetical protein